MSDGNSIGLTCRLCGNRSGNSLHQAREMFLGTRDCFAYIECRSCGTLQIQRVPELQDYYPRSYYSFQFAGEQRIEFPTSLWECATRSVGGFLRRNAADYYCKRHSPAKSRNFLGRHVSEKMKRLTVGFPDYIKDTTLDLSVNRSSKILDVGCGAGINLLSLGAFGFSNLIGVDPFLSADITYRNGVRILKTELAKLEAEFDLIIASHSLEHVPEPRETLRQIHRLLRKGQWAIVRIPLLAYAWEKYGTDWVQLDAPRHLFLFSSQRFSALASETGFTVAQVSFDSTAFQFWGSEQYQQDIPLIDERSYFVNPQNSIFSAPQLKEFSRKATELNERKEGDQAIFYLRKP